MASTQLNVYDTVGNREGLTDRVADLFADDVPFFAAARKVPAIATKHEWQADSLAAAATTGVVEGASISYTQPTARTRHSNYTHIRLRNWDVTHTQMAVSTAGIENEAARALLKAMKELLRDYDKIFLNSGNSAAGATATARTARGIQNAIISNSAVGTGSGSSALIKLTESAVNNLMQQIWDEGGDPRALYCSGIQKRVISQDFTAKTGFSFNINASTRTAIANINNYEGSFGTLQVIPDRQHMLQRITIVQPDQIKVAVLNDISQFEGAKTASSVKGWVEGEMTLEWGNEKAHAKHTHLATNVTGV